MSFSTPYNKPYQNIKEKNVYTIFNFQLLQKGYPRANSTIIHTVTKKYHGDTILRKGI